VCVCVCGSSKDGGEKGIDIKGALDSHACAHASATVLEMVESLVGV